MSLLMLKPKINYRVLKIPLLDSIQRDMNQIHTLKFPF
jgi:hypothetical protein